MKGHYEVAVEDDTPCMWVQKGGELVTHLLVISNLRFGTFQVPNIFVQGK